MEVLNLRLPQALDPLDPCDPSTEIGRRRGDLRRLEHEVAAEALRRCQTDPLGSARYAITALEILQQAREQLDQDADAFWAERRQLVAKAHERCRRERDALDQAMEDLGRHLERHQASMCRSCPSPSPTPSPRKDNNDTSLSQLVRRYRGPERRKDGCGMAVLQRHTAQPDVHRTVHVSCGCWDCGHCGARLAAQWHQHLASAFTTVTGILHQVRVAAGRAWGTLQRRIQRAGASYVRVLRGDGDFDVVMTLPEGEPVEDLEDVIGQLLRAIPRVQTESRKISTSRDWSLSRSTKTLAEPESPDKTPDAAGSTDSDWDTLGQVQRSPEDVIDVLTRAAIRSTLHGADQPVVRFRATPGTRYYEALIAQILSRPKRAAKTPPAPASEWTRGLCHLAPGAG